MSFSTMCAMRQYRGHGLSEALLKEQWRYLKQVEDDEAHEKPMLCAQGCGVPVTRRKKCLSPEAQYELLRKSCCSACWMHAHFPQEYVRLGWDQREAHHGGGCLQDLLKNSPSRRKTSMLSRQANGNTWKPEGMRPIVAYAQREISPTVLEYVATVCLHSPAMLCEALCIAMQKCI